MALASGAVDLDAVHAERGIFGITDVGFIDRLPKARPACAGFKFLFDLKKVCSTTDAFIDPFFMIFRRLFSH